MVHVTPQEKEEQVKITTRLPARFWPKEAAHGARRARLIKLLELGEAAEVAAKDKRIAELEEALRAVGRWADAWDEEFSPPLSGAEMQEYDRALTLAGLSITRYNGELIRRILADVVPIIQEALGDAAPQLPPNACRCARCEAKRNPGQRQYDEETGRWVVFDGERIREEGEDESDV